jgi:hypothetical protein
MQTAAWTGMIVSRSLTGGVTLAVETTLDGRHPCKLRLGDCRRSEKGGAAVSKGVKPPQKIRSPKFVLPRRRKPDSCRNLRRSGHISIVCVLPGGRSDAPPTPPPLALTGRDAPLKNRSSQVFHPDPGTA